ncbi:hypothetical protein [Streptococcus suis]|uniref:hypothetical protein n=1 Tax=Streptococcus suis TaxID=1307 RepID=UPI0037055F21
MTFDSQQIEVSQVVDLVDRLTTAYYSSLALIFTIVLGTIAFLIYDKNSLKKEMREKYEEIVKIKSEELKQEIESNLDKLKDENVIELKRIENLSYYNYVKDSLRNISTRSNKLLIWNIVHNYYKRCLRLIIDIIDNENIPKGKKEKYILSIVNRINYISNQVKKPKLFLFKRLSNKALEHLNSVIDIEKNISIVLKKYNIARECQIMKIDVESNIEKQKHLKDLTDSLENLQKLTQKTTQKENV